jgi:nitrite reductase/ring-hydroxylating ferredoxin subunit
VAHRDLSLRRHALRHRQLLPARGPLGEYLEPDGVIACRGAPGLRVRTGISPIDPDLKVRSYPVRVENGQIVVEID